MLWKLFLLFTLVPLLELTLLLLLADWTNWKVTLALVLTTGVAGAWLARAQGTRAVRRIREQLRAGQLPSQALLDSVLILIAAALLLTPGILTDAFGLTLLIPVTRAYYRRRLVAYFQTRFRVQWERRRPAASAETIDADFRPSDPRPSDPRPSDPRPSDPRLGGNP